MRSARRPLGSPPTRRRRCAAAHAGPGRRRRRRPAPPRRCRTLWRRATTCGRPCRRLPRRR
ncbi:MAG: hypothetical protein GEU94_09750 [Micromonosporaceae bacterium]|nr:hypothetical protein [Micromonosporaceae bacterium]